MHIFGISLILYLLKLLAGQGLLKKDIHNSILNFYIVNLAWKGRKSCYGDLTNSYLFCYLTMTDSPIFAATKE